MRILGLDIGERRIGVAVSDELMLTAQGLCVIDSRGAAKDIEQIVLLARQRDITHVVIGLPRNMNGSLGPMAEKINLFGEQLKMHCPEVLIEYWDERLTTSAAQRTLMEADLSRRRRRQVVDKVAAVLILQGYMDAFAQRKKRMDEPS
jgi:putative holliday junction resolvase